MKKIPKLFKLLLCFIGLFLIYLLGANNNAVPEPFIQNIIKPIKHGTGTFYFHGLVLIIAVYLLLNIINKIQENTFTKTRWRRIITLIILINVFSIMKEAPIKIYKKFSNKEYFIHPKEEKFIDIHEELKSDINDKYMSGQFRAFEYLLYNDESQIIFKGEDHMYQE